MEALASRKVVVREDWTEGSGTAKVGTLSWLVIAKGMIQESDKRLVSLDSRTISDEGRRKYDSALSDGTATADEWHIILKPESFQRLISRFGGDRRKEDATTWGGLGLVSLVETKKSAEVIVANCF